MFWNWGPPTGRACLPARILGPLITEDVNETVTLYKSRTTEISGGICPLGTALKNTRKQNQMETLSGNVFSPAAAAHLAKSSTERTELVNTMQTFHDKNRVHETHYVLQEIGVEGSLADRGNQRTEREGCLHRGDDGRDGGGQPEGRKMEGRCMGKTTFWAVVSILNNFAAPHSRLPREH